MKIPQCRSESWIEQSALSRDSKAGPSGPSSRLARIARCAGGMYVGHHSSRAESMWRGPDVIYVASLAARVTAARCLAHNGPMRDASSHSPSSDNQGLWQQVQLSRGHWQREDAAGGTRSAGWWESVTVTWSPAPAPDRRPAVLPRALTAAADMIAPVLADVAIASIRRLVQREHCRLPVVLRRQLVPAPRELARPDRAP